MHSSSKCDKWPSIRQCPLWRQKWIIDIVMIPGTQCPVCLLLLLLLFLLLLLLVCCCLRVQPANQPNPQSQPTQLLLSCRSGSHTSYLLFHYSYCVWLVFIGATKACFKSQHGVFQSKQLKAACDRCDFSPPPDQRFVNPSSLSAERGRAAADSRRNVVLDRNINLSGPSRSSSIRSHMPDVLCVYVPFS